MKQPCKVFVPITKPLIKSIHCAARRHGLSPADLYSLVADLIGIPSVTALSIHEAQFLLSKIMSQTTRPSPLPPPRETEIEGEGANLPSFYHVRDIRLMFRELAWDKAKIEGWLHKWRKVKNIRSLDRRNAQGTWIALKNIVSRESGCDRASH